MTYSNKNLVRVNKLGRDGFAWLELLLAISVLLLVLQLVPDLAAALDVRTWSRSVWFIINSLAALALLGIRFMPEAFRNWRERQAHHSGDKASHEQRRKAKEHRRAIEEIQRARKRRIY